MGAHSPKAIVSFKVFIENHSDEMYDHYRVPHLRGARTRETVEAFFKEVVLPAGNVPGGLLTMMYFAFINAWWPLRDAPNVLMLHFNGMKEDHEGSLKRIAAFLGCDGMAPDAWARVVEYTSFPWMKKEESKFEAQTLLGKKNKR